MDLITVVDNEYAWVSSKGRYMQLPIYRRGNQLFVKSGNSFYGLYREGTTTNPNLRWLDMTLPVRNFDRVGRLLRYPEKMSIAS